MWTAFARSGLWLAALTFLMWVLVQILTPILDIAGSGPHSDAESVQQISTWFSLLTVDNLVLLVGLSVGVYLLGRAATERRLTR